MPDNSLRLRRKENRAKRLIMVISTCAVLINLATFGKGGKLKIFLMIVFVREYMTSNYKL